MENNRLIVENGNVILVDPNFVNVDNNMTNSVPQYQDMYIFAELTAISKGRTVIINDIAKSESSHKINLIGNDQNNDPNNPNHLKFTTNYYDGSNPNGIYYEGFGMDSIKIVTNSSYVPQVDIRFVDIRGLTFFNQNESPYRILFDFPPPTFKLTVKGFYGNAITYELHLVKYTTEFSSENGNFNIDAQFVAMTFAPLADILFRYVVNFPLINERSSVEPLSSERPNNTFELIVRLKNLYSIITDKMDTDADNVNFKKNQDALLAIDDIIDHLSYLLSGDSEKLKSGGIAHFVIRTENTGEYRSYDELEKYSYRKINSLSEYNNVIKSENNLVSMNPTESRLFIMYVLGTNIRENDDGFISNEWIDNYTTPIYNPSIDQNGAYNKPRKALLGIRENLINNNTGSLGISESLIKQPSSFVCGINIETNSNTKTLNYGMDITDYYYHIYTKKTKTLNDQIELSQIISDKINEMTMQNLGMLPSIYNIFDIILGDVDKVFATIATTSIEAEASHNIPANFDIITNNNIDSPSSSGNIPDHVYPFPLIINQANVYGGVKSERVAPTELARRNVRFPELILVDEFIKTFPFQQDFERLYNWRINQDADGRFRWIPICPLDSKLGTASPQSPYLKIGDSTSDEILTRFMKRFYILSQGIINNNFYSISGKKRKVYHELYVNGEAINIAEAILTIDNANNLKIQSDRFKDSVDAFYSHMSKISTKYDNGDEFIDGDLISFANNSPKSFPVTPTNISEGSIYTNKNNDDFIGFNLYSGFINTNTIGDNSEATPKHPVDKFNHEAKTNWLVGLFGGGISEENFKFSDENIIYFSDANTFKDEQNINYTRYISSIPYIMDSSTYGNPLYPKSQIEAYEKGNKSFGELLRGDGHILTINESIIKIWANNLSDSRIADVINNSNTNNIAQLLILSNFGSTISPFNKYPSSLNNLIFTTPSAIEVPAFYAPYIGLLLTAIDDEWEDDIIEFYTGATSLGRLGNYRGFYVLADLHDIKLYLSDSDKKQFKSIYNGFISTLSDIIIQMRNMDVFVEKHTGEGKDFTDRSIAIKYCLDDTVENKKGINDSGQYKSIIESMMKSKSLIVYSDKTFEMTTDYPVGYTSVMNLSENEKAINKTFFESFFKTLSDKLKDRIDTLDGEKKNLNELRGDNDIINQLYYSFKNINDKWITGNAGSGKYPFNRGGRKLIDSFAFVDRAMNPIGETMLNAEILIQMFDDHNISLYTVISQLLSLNNFEFFPIQNFLRFDRGGWADSFKIHTGSVHSDTSAAFVCMYIGGSSSYPSVDGNGFVNDGIIDLGSPEVTDFATEKTDDFKINQLLRTSEDALDENDKQILSGSVPFQEVRAFRVRFGEQNQSMFKDIKIDSKEYPETNESIQILSRLAGDNNKSAPVPKGQNLYNLYENRSYKATVTGLGNAMIQPTQYFQLENVPLFNGAYIILSVEHNITPNKMTTSFSGTKLLKHPIPRVLDPMALTPHNPRSDAGDMVKHASVAFNNNNKSKFTAMYMNTDNSLKIE